MDITYERYSIVNCNVQLIFIDIHNNMMMKNCLTHYFKTNFRVRFIYNFVILFFIELR